MKWICVLHLYQPPFQKPRIFNQIVNECYLPLTQMLLKRKPDFSMYCNVNQSLLDQLKQGNTMVLSNITQLLSQKRLRLTLTPSYHPIIPIIPKHVVIQQITNNQFAMKKQFKFSNYDLFFPPELAFDPADDVGLAKELAILLSQDALKSEKYTPFVTYKQRKFVIRHNDLSNMIMGGQVKSFKNINLNLMANNSDYLVTAVDGETFGHHRKGYVEVLDNLLNEVETCYVPTDNYIKVPDLVASSWSSVQGQPPFILWKDKKNKIHKLLWKFSRLVQRSVKTKQDKVNYFKSLSSCTFWWASANPWWSIEMIESGAWQMYLSVCQNKELRSVAYKLYTEIISLAFKWQREGIIDKKFEHQLTKQVPFSKRCKQDEFEYYILKFKKAEKQALLDKNYELAIRWRDAVIKLENNIDQFDDWHVVDQLKGYK